MSTDENLVARNQETAEANGLAAAHTRGRNLHLLFLIRLRLPLRPSRARHPASFPLSFAIGCPSKYNYAKNNSAIAISAVRRHSRLVAYRNGNSLCTRLAFDDRFFDRSMSRPARSRLARETVSNLILVIERE